MSKQLTWLEEQFPDIDFNFVVGYNAMAYYSDLNDRGSLPDIITCRRFSLNDAAHLADELMDLGQTEVVGSFYESYIENNREPDGANPIRHKNVIPATSGMEYTMKDNGDGTYTLEDLTINGQPLDDDAVYNVLLLGDDDYICSAIYCNCPMPEELQAKRVELNVGTYNSYDYFLDAVNKCGQLEAPADYVTILIDDEKMNLTFKKTQKGGRVNA